MADAALQTVNLVTQELQTQTLNSIVGVSLSPPRCLGWTSFAGLLPRLSRCPRRWRSVRSYRSPHLPPLRCGLPRDLSCQRQGR